MDLHKCSTNIDFSSVMLCVFLHAGGVMTLKMVSKLLNISIVTFTCSQMYWLSPNTEDGALSFVTTIVCCSTVSPVSTNVAITIYVKDSLRVLVGLLHMM